MLSVSDFKTAVALLPLVSIDLLVSDQQGALLVGRRVNPPARGFWFVPGGRVRKGESLDDAFMRITQGELGCAFGRTEAEFAGVWEHFYDDDFTGSQEGGGTHYVVLAYRLDLDPRHLDLPLAQHHAYRWMSPEEVLADAHVHANTRAYVEP